MSALIPRPRAQVAPGAVHVPGWLSVAEQRRLVAACRDWARPPAGMRATRLPRGGVMSVRTVCLGWHWVPYRYSRIAEDVDGAPVKPFPGWLADLGRRAVVEVGGWHEVFRFGNTRDRGRPWTDVSLESGDLFVFGGSSRLAYHGVPKTLAGTGDSDIGLASGRLNITLRESGLDVAAPPPPAAGD
jgi:DNA oxidative demethylase